MMGILVLVVGLLLIVVGVRGGGMATAQVRAPRIAWSTRMKALGIGLLLVGIVLSTRNRPDHHVTRGVTQAELDTLFGRPEMSDTEAVADSTLPATAMP